MGVVRQNICCSAVLVFVFFLQTICAEQLSVCPEDFEAPRLTWSGYIDNENCYDTRQIVGFLNNIGILFPRPIKLDAHDRDINAHGAYRMTAFNLGLDARLDTAPLLCSQQTYAYIATDFLGISNDIAPVWRFRRAYIHFDWGPYAMTVGGQNHPNYNDSTTVNSVGYETGGPIAPSTRNPQIRFIWRPDYYTEKECGSKEHDEIWFTLLSQSDVFTSPGPLGYTPKYIQDGVVPALDLQWRKHIDDATIFGIGGTFKRIVPRLSTPDMDFKDPKGVTSGVFYTYCSHVTPECSSRTQLIYAHDGSDLGLIGGYAVASENPLTKKRTYANLRSLSVWTDFELFSQSSLSPGFFLGVARNFGANKKLFRDEFGELITYPENVNVKVVARFAPRVWCRCGPINFGAEVNWTYASYGTLNDYGNPILDVQPVSVVRFLAVTYYKF